MIDLLRLSNPGHRWATVLLWMAGIILHPPISILHLEVLSRLDGLEKDVLAIKEALFQTRAEFRQEQAQMRAEFREDLGELRREMHGRFDDIHHQMIVQTRWPS